MARRPSLRQQFLASPELQEQARAYLTARGYNVSKLKAPQLYRYTTKVAKAETGGEPLPTLGELRGHAGEVSVEHIEQDSASRRREHYFIRRSRKIEEQAAALREAGDWEGLFEIQFTHADFKRLVQAVQKADKAAGHRRIEWPIIVRGWAKKYPGWAPDPESNPLHFIKGAQVSARNDNIVYYLTQETQDTLPLIDFLNLLYGEKEVEWVDVQQIAIALFYESEESASDQQRKQRK